MPRDLWPSAGVEYSRVRKELAAAESAMQTAKRDAAQYRLALILARRYVVWITQQAPDLQAVWWALAVLDAALAQTRLGAARGVKPSKRPARVQ